MIDQDFIELPRSGTPEDQIEDAEFEDVILDVVDGQTVTHDGGLTFGLPEIKDFDPPAVGDRVRFWPDAKWGTRIRGVALRGTVLYYRTAEESAARDKATLEDSESKEKAQFEAKGKAAQQARYEALPEPFRKRIDVRRRYNPDFGWRYESYELFSCEQAVVFAERARKIVGVAMGDTADVAAYFEGKPAEQVPDTPEARWLFWWRDLTSPDIRDFDRQREEMPSMSDGHSGNTFGTAFSLAVIWLLHGEEGVIKQHGALAALVGSNAYGDPPTFKPGDAVVLIEEPSQWGSVSVESYESDPDAIGVTWFPTRGISQVKREEIRLATMEEQTLRGIKR